MAIDSSASHWNNLTPALQNILIEFTNRGKEKKAMTSSEELQTRKSYVFKYGAVRDTVSSSKSQANATQSAIDVGGGRGAYSATCISRRRSCIILNLGKEHTTHVKERVLLRIRATLSCDDSSKSCFRILAAAFKRFHSEGIKSSD